MRPLPSSPAHPLDPASLGISQRDKALSGCAGNTAQGKQRTTNCSAQLWLPDKANSLPISLPVLSTAMALRHGKPLSREREREMLRDFPHPKLRFSPEPSSELLDSQGTNQKTQAETGRALGKKQGTLTCLRPCLWQGRPWTEPQETCTVLFPMPTSAHTLTLTTSSGWAQVPLRI